MEGDEIRCITSNDVNDYLHDVTGGPFTAKDYRTWAATLGAAMLLCAVASPGSQRECKACIKHAIDAVAMKLGHTPTVCRKSYIHPRVISDFSTGMLARQLSRQLHRRVKDVTTDAGALTLAGMRAVEPVVARYLDATPPRRRI